MLTAHRAKGLEFDHLVVLDGAWNKIGKGEDKDASRRLYYVAMTRARQTLSLLSFDGKHKIIDDLAINNASTVAQMPLISDYLEDALSGIRAGLDFVDNLEAAQTQFISYDGTDSATSIYFDGHKSDSFQISTSDTAEDIQTRIAGLQFVIDSASDETTANRISSVVVEGSKALRLPFKRRGLVHDQAKG